MTTSRTIPTRGALAALLVPLFVIAGLALDSVAQASTPGTGCAGSYGWPVKPFDRAHPVRGGGRVTVECGNGRTFQYWHIEPAIRVGQRAVAGQTLLGFVLPKREHVHLTQLEDGRAVNPLAPRRLAPYSDATVPAVNAITIRRFRERLPRSRPRPSTCPRCPFLVGGTAFPRPRLSSRGGSKTPQSASSSERASRATSVEPFRRTIASGTRSLVGHTRTGPCSTAARSAE